MSSRYFATLTAFTFCLMLLIPSKVFSQIIKPTGVTTRASSQLVTWFDEDDSDNTLQVTNTNDTQGVWIHVQIFRSYNVTPDPLVNVFCDERDFIDFLTPNDTHVYDLDEENFVKNIGETETDPGESTTLDLEDPSSQGFIIITPVVSESDLTAISFQHMIGSFEGPSSTYFNIMGRDAVDFTTGNILEDNTPLDGMTGGFVVLQPSEFVFNLMDDADVSLVAIAFQDVYGPPGLLGYQAVAATANWTSFIFDFKEDPTSCGNRAVDCYMNIGIEDNSFPQSNTTLGDDLLCSGFEMPSTIDGTNGETDDIYGWTRVFVSGLGDFVNHLGVINIDFFDPDMDDLVWLQTK